MCSLRFIHTASHSEPSFEASFQPSRLGGHITRSLIADFTFLENVMNDTFIADDAVWKKIKEKTDMIYKQKDVLKRIMIRKDRIEAFFEYMRKSYSVLHEESIKRGLPSEWCSHPMNNIKPEFLRNLEHVVSSAQKNYGGDREKAA